MQSRHSSRRAFPRTLFATAASIALTGACAFDPDNLPEMTFAVPDDQVWKAPPAIPPPAAGEGRVLVTNNLDDTVSIIDLDAALAGSPRVVGRVPVGFVPVEREGPHHVTADAAGEFYYVGISNFVPGSGSGPHGVHGSGSADGHLLKLKVEDNSLVGTVRIDRNPGDVRLTPDGSLLLATHFDILRITEAGAEGITSGPELDSRLGVVDPATMTRLALVPACPAAHGIGITPDSSTVVMSCLSDEVAIVDLAGVRAGREDVVTRVPVIASPGTAAQPSCAPYAITMDGETAWASCFNTGEIVAVDVAGRQLDGRTFQLQGLAVFGDVREGLLVIAHQSTDGITVLDTSAGPGDGPAFVSTRLFSPDECVLPHYARFSDDGGKILLVCEGNKSSPGALVVLEATAPHAVLGKVDLGIFPDDMAVLRRTP